MTEAAGTPIGLQIEGANRHDMKLVEDTLASVPQSIEDKRLEHLRAGKEEQGLCMDAGYDYDQVREIAWEFGYTTHIRKRGEEKKRRPKQRARRRGAGWLSEPIPGSTATGVCSSDGKRRLGTTWPCCTLLALSSPGIVPYLDKH